ncbi:GGDEF domain-containing protein [Demequina salsinemoris]|uniref:GGDEF domain-containing protein n=1 Tax=Demequina salsinemoris TaxID=577470 RepID=UPI001364DA02|nr:GGDEF domain-containing protein [Demequina salsinemoris]
MSTPGRVACCALVLALASSAVYLASPPAVGGAIVVLTSVLAASAVIPHLRTAVGSMRLVYSLLLAGFVLMVMNEASYLAVVTVGVSESAVDAISVPMVGAAYVLLLAASLLAMAPALRYDTGGVLDAATLAIATASVLWQVFLAPALDSVDAPRAQTVSTFAATIVLSGTVGVVIGVGVNGSVSRSARPVLGYFLAALLIAVAGNGLNATATDPVTGADAWWTDVLWPLSYIAAWAALAHPMGSAVFEVGRPHQSRLTTRRLVALGVAMVITPAIAVVRSFTDGYVDWLTGAITTLAIVVMVLARVSQLAAAHRDAEARLRILAERDALTGLPNRRAVEQHLGDLASRVATGHALGAVVCFVDLDDFKGVNDAHGHAVGDELLAAVAARLAGLARSESDDLVGRLGGDEFIVIGEGDPSLASAPMMARIAHAFETSFALSDGPMTMSASIGLATASPSELHTVDELLTQADHAMYDDKRRRGTASGRDGA